MVKLSTAKNYLKSEDVKQGDMVTILSEGEWVASAKYTYSDGTPRKDFLLKVKHGEAEKDFRLNATNKKTLVKAYGEETADWVGKIISLETANVMVSGKMMKTMIATPVGTTKNTQYEA